jgi:hypothetical protein
LKDAPGVAAADVPTGVVSDRIHSHPEYSVSGVKVSKAHAHSLLVGANGLADDSDLWHLTCVGDIALQQRFGNDLDALPGPVRIKLHVQRYEPGHWAVAQFKLPAGVSLRKPSPGRVAADVGAVPPSEYSAARLADLLAMTGGPLWRPAPPKQPAPNPGPDPLEPVKPGPKVGPGPDKAPEPGPDKTPACVLCAALLAALLAVFKDRIFVVKKEG